MNDTLTMQVAARQETSYVGYVSVTLDLFVLIMATTAPTPLYPLYQEAWHFSPGPLTVVFAGYVLGLLATLLFFGRLSDAIGRRAVLLVAVGVSALGSAAFLVARGVAALFIGRALHGAAIGLTFG